MPRLQFAAKANRCMPLHGMGKLLPNGPPAFVRLCISNDVMCDVPLPPWSHGLLHCTRALDQVLIARVGRTACIGQEYVRRKALEASLGTYRESTPHIQHVGCVHLRMCSSRGSA